MPQPQRTAQCSVQKLVASSLDHGGETLVEWEKQAEIKKPYHHKAIRLNSFTIWVLHPPFMFIP